MVTDRVYLDHAATTPLRPVAAEAMTATWATYGNASSLHASGRAARRLVEESRERIAAAVGARPAEVIFTAGGTEADNLALLGSVGGRPDRPELAVSTIEHPAVAETAAALARTGRYRLVELDVDLHGRLDVDAASARVGDQTAVVSVMWVNNETGTVQPLAEVAATARAHGAWVHSDGVQALGHLPVRFDDHLDLVSLSAHKVGGPVGVGALLARRELALRPVNHGGGQERDVRSGTVPVALIAGFAAAVEAVVTDQPAEDVRLRRLRDRLGRGALAAVVDSRLNGSLDADRSQSGIVNLELTGADADAVLMLLDRAGIDCSTGSACTAGVSQPSEVLMAMGRTRSQAGSALRFSLGWTSTDADVDALLAALPGAVTAARAAGRT